MAGNLKEQKMQDRVRDALIIAGRLARQREQPVEISHALLGAVIISHTTTSPAFSWLASKIEIPKSVEVDIEINSNDTVDQYPLSPSFLAYYNAALRFVVDDEKGMQDWDFITMILLAVEDPHLHEILKEHQQSPIQLLQEWFAFRVFSEGESADKDGLAKWWLSTGVEPPAKEDMERYQEDFHKTFPGAPPAPESGTAHAQEAEAGSGPEAQKAENGDETGDENGAVPEPSAQRPGEAIQKQRDISLDIPDPQPFGNNDSPPGSSEESRKRLEATAGDRLRVKSQAKAFATLLISKSAKGPFAIALLGAWGVGKTHFMRIMQETIESVTGKARKPGPESDTVSRVAQIEFNAWHYVDTSLWASLASHIFDELAKELKPAGDPQEKVRLALRKKIFSSGQEIKKAEAAVEAAKNERSAALEKLAEKKSNRGEALQAVWNALTARPETTDAKKLMAMKHGTNRIVKKLGIPETLDTAKDIESVYKSLKDVKSRGQALVNAIDTAFNSKNRWASAIFLLVLVCLVFALPWLIDYLNPDLLNGASVSPVLQATAFLGPIIIWISKHINAVSKAMGYLETLQGILESPPAGHEDLKAAIAGCDAAILAESERVKKAELEISRAQAEIQRINSGGLVYDFLEKKRADTRYIERMGLISVIRKDFEELKSVLKEWNRNEKGINPIERIVLYIDDLDRCPTHRVVDVLQAVHLLLAFDLFNVVVAVDARWLERSLNEAYNPSEKLKNGGSFAGIPHRFSAHNYLEKIFQIPFTLPVMGEDGYRALIETLVTPAAAVAEPEFPEGTDHGDHHGDGGKPVEDTPRDTPRDDPRHNPLDTAGHTPGGGGKDDAGDRDDPGEKDIRKAEQEKIRRAAEQAANKARLKAMELLPHEKAFIKSLYGFIPTPRLANRFVNIYRMLRVRAKSLNKDMASFLNRESGAYRAVLLLLAITTGHPRSAPALISGLNRGAETFSEWLTLMQTGGAGKNGGDLPMDVKDELGKIELKIASVTASSVKSGEAGIDQDMTHYRKWASEVGRYSFRWHLKEK